MEQNEWIIAGGLIAAPLVLFLIVELFAFRRRRREKALAQRPKSRPRDLPKSRSRRAH